MRRFGQGWLSTDRRVPNQSDPAPTDPTQPDPTDPTDPTRPTDPTQTDPTQTDPTQTDPTQTDPNLRSRVCVTAQKLCRSVW